MPRAVGSGRQPAMASCHPNCIKMDETEAEPIVHDYKAKNDKSSRTEKLQRKINVKKLRNSLNIIEKKLSGLWKNYENETKTTGEIRSSKQRGLKPSWMRAEPLSEKNVPDIDVSAIDVDDKDTVPEKDVGFITPKLPSKLPVLDKSKFDDMPKTTTEVLTKVVGLETLYGVLMEEHLGLQLCLQETTRRLRAEELRRREVEVEDRKNPINLALAERIREMDSQMECLRRKVHELQEENDHLEFRLLEMDEPPIKKTIYRGSEGMRYDVTDIDDVSDSGVMSLPASDDEHHDFFMEASSEDDVKSQLLVLSQSSEFPERVCLQQGLALLRHYESRIQTLESTIAAMCHEATLARGLKTEEMRTTSRVIATVLPFTERKDCLQESGIFEEAEWVSRGTQTEPGTGEHQGDLSTELKKLSRIREKIETGSHHLHQELPPLKQISYYRERVETLEGRLALYEASPEEGTKLLRAQLEKEARLEAEVRHLRQRLAKLEAENRALEEERCELEEVENDTRLRCQKLERKLNTLGEKKSCLKAQLAQLNREMASLRDDKKQASRMENLVKTYEKKNQELEEKEMEARYRLQMLENTMPALMMWNMWRMMMAMQPGCAPQSLPGGMPGQQTLPNVAANAREEELIIKLQALEQRLNVENSQLEESRNAEEILRHKVKDMEDLIETKDSTILAVLNRENSIDVEAFEKLSKMAKERLEMDRRIKDLELKEKMYQETLQQADSMFAQMESSYVSQIQEKDDLLFDREARLEETESRLRQTAGLSESNMVLQEKLIQLEIEMNQIKENLKRRGMERECLEKEEQRLNLELQECSRELQKMKDNIEGPLKGQLEVQKKRASTLSKELERVESEKAEMEERHIKEVSSLKGRINHLSRDLMESDVTIGELREEVQTLESTINEVRYISSMEKMEFEELRKSYEARLEEKEREVEELRESMKSKPQRTKSLKEELEELRCERSEMASAMVTGGLHQEIETEIAVAKGEFRRCLQEEEPRNSFSYSSLGRVPEIYEEDAGSLMKRYLMDSPPPTGVQCSPEDSLMLKTKTAQEIRLLIEEIERGEPLLDVESTKGILTDLPLHATCLPPDCQVAHNAVTNSSGKDIKGTVENLNRAFQHSKTCKKCSEILGGFLQDLIKELGVKLPSVEPFRDKEPAYAGAPSDVKTPEVGAGTVGFNAADSERGYRVKPTVSTLALTVEQLEEKCRVKDSMIQAMADELRHLQRCNTWEGPGELLKTVADREVPTAKVDFDRRTLCNYLNDEPIHSLTTPEEDESREFKATNPLGLTVMRQVGPDSLLIQWKSPPPGRVHSYEIFINGMYVQRIRSPGRTKALLHPVDLSSKIYITLNAVSYTGQTCEGVTIPYP